jgi:thiamine-phosphate pyrophosphorylase
LLLYYITDRRQFAGGPGRQRSALLARIGEAAGLGLELIQLREKDLGSRELEQLAREAIEAVRHNAQSAGSTRLLVNSRIDVAIAADCDGVHLPATDLEIPTARQIFTAAGRGGLVGISCHSGDEVSRAVAVSADFVVLGPVFEKLLDPKRPLLGLAGLAEGCRAAAAHDSHVPVLALGGVSVAKACSCRQAGAQGIAGIRLFQHNDLAETVRQLRDVVEPL